MKEVLIVSFMFLILIYPTLAQTNQEGGESFEEAPQSQEDQIQLVEQETGLKGEGLQGATKNSDGTVSIQSASSLKSKDGKTYRNVKNAKVDSSGNIIEAESLEYAGGFYKGVKNFQPQENGNFQIEQADQVALDGNLITGGKRITFQNGILSADFAESFVKAGTFANNIEGLESDAVSFSVGAAEQVLAGCVEVKGIQDTEFTLYGNALDISPQTHSVFLNDCDENEVQVEPLGEDSKITISKDQPSKYKLQQSIITCGNSQKKEILEANTSAILQMSNDCFSCMTIDPVGTYWHRSEKVISDFGIKVPKEGSKYRVCLRKVDGQPFEQFDGLIDFIEHKVELNGIVNYLRMPFIAHSETMSGYTLLSPFTPQPLYESYDHSNNVTMQLDAQFNEVENLYFENNNPQVEKLAQTSSGFHTLVESHNNNRFERFEIIRKKPVASLVKSYSSKHILPKIWIHSFLIQENKELKSRITVHEPDQKSLEKLSKLLEQTHRRHGLSN